MSARDVPPEGASPRRSGTVQRYDPILRYGFINDDNGRVHFVHRFDVDGPPLLAGERVTFESELNPEHRYPRARHVRRVPTPPAAA